MPATIRFDRSRSCGAPSFDDVIVGTWKDDRLAGNQGRDRLFGRGETDELEGDQDNDRCDGGDGHRDTAADCEHLRGVP